MCIETSGEFQSINMNNLYKISLAQSLFIRVDFFQKNFRGAQIFFQEFMCIRHRVIDLLEKLKIYLYTGNLIMRIDEELIIMKNRKIKLKLIAAESHQVLGKSKDRDSETSILSEHATIELWWHEHEKPFFKLLQD